MRNPVIILGDCDSFYWSVEAVFNPSVRNRPGIVLSNNDGCGISANQLAKKLGAYTGVPYFEIKKEFEAAGGVAFSANYTLYGDISSRVMWYICEFAGGNGFTEFYSVDECYIVIDYYPELENDLIKLRKRIKKDIGIPVTFCAASTKTRAKAGMETAKKISQRVFMFLDEELVEFCLKRMKVSDIWGVGRASAAKLNAIGVQTALQLAKADPKRIRKLLTITGERTQLELCGVSCIELKTELDPKKGITTTRSFLTPVYELEEVEKFLSDHVMNATEKLRDTDQVCHHMSIFLYSNHFKENQEQCFLSAQIPLDQGEDAPNVLAKKAIQAMRAIFKWGYEFRKCGVILTDLRPKAQRQLSLFNTDYEKNEKITEAIDRVNKKFGPRKLKLMSCNKDIPQPRSGKKSGRYTTRYEESLVVKI